MRYTVGVSFLPLPAADIMFTGAHGAIIHPVFLPASAGSLVFMSK
jgi:hypothetical protein